MKKKYSIQPLEQFYNSLENIKSFNIWNINKEINAIEGDLLTEHIDNVLTERKVLSYNLNKGDLISNWSSTNVDGTVVSIPIFSQIELEYISVRLKQTSNIWLIARYSHILWSETKNNEKARISILNYIKILNAIDKNEYQEIYPIFSAIFKISKKTKIYTVEIKSLTLYFLDFLPYWSSTNIISSIFENNIFSQKELTEISNKLLDSFKIDSPISYFLNKNFLEILLQLFDKVKKPNHKIYEFLAINEDLVLDQHDDSSFVKLTNTGKKLQYLKHAKQPTEYEKTLIEYARLKKIVDLPKHTVEFDDHLHEMLNKYLEMKSEAILKLSGENILAYFAVQKDLVVDSKENSESSIGRFKGSIRQLFNSSVLDINNNFKELHTDKDKINYDIMQSYALNHSIRFYTLFLVVFNKAIVRGKINYYTVIHFLKHNTWYGIKYKRSIGLQEEDENTSWISLLAPGLFNFFSQYEMQVLLNTNKVNNYIIAIDSLTMKFEGALRDFIRLTGGSTTIEKKNELKEQLLEELLDNDIIKRYFDENDIELFKFIFTKKGKNIRNNVAHSFMEYSDYNLQVASNIIFCLLRLGKYTFEKQT